MKRTTTQRLPKKMASKRKISCAILLAIATTMSQSTQTSAFSPSSLKPKGGSSFVHTTKSWRGSSNNNNNNKSGQKIETDLLTRRTAKVSNFALSSTAAAAANNVASAATTTAATAAPMISPSNLSVSLDRPLLSPVEYSYRAPSSSSKGMWSSFLAVLLSDVCKTALVAFLLAVGFTLVPKLVSSIRTKTTATTTTTDNNNEGKSSFLSTLASRIITPIQDMLSPLSSSSSKSKQEREAYSTPMPFEGDGGWGKSTLRSKKRIGTFTVYEFALPESYYTIPLALGQQLEFCCLSSNDDICTGSFFPYNDSGEDMNKAGVMRVVMPNDKMADEGNAKFMDVLRNELRPGDEVAIKPGKNHLTYHGKHVPVTDMVYVASGLGIVPIIDQIKAITPKGSSSVKVSSVIWMNDNRDDFELAMNDLEAEYMKHPSKLAVSCIMDDVMKNPMEGNKEVEEAVPYFNAGTMAVVCGPKRFAEKAKGYLMRKGYPENCICVLP